MFLEDFDHLLEAGHLAPDNVVAEDNGEGLVPDKVLGAENGVSEAERFALPDVGEIGEVLDLPEFVAELPFPFFCQSVFKLERDVEVVFDGPLAPSRDEDDLGDAGLLRLFDAVLDERLVHESQHLFRHGLGGGEKSGAEPADGENGLPDSHVVSFRTYPDPFRQGTVSCYETVPQRSRFFPAWDPFHLDLDSESC